MPHCCTHNEEASRLFGWFAARYRKRFARSGLEASQKQLLHALERCGFAGSSLLEIGCGTGYLHQRMLQDGADHVIGIDLSAKMIEVAREQALDLGLAARTDYRVGDFVELTDPPAAEIVILDKVICCYPDADALVRQSADVARRVYAFTIPRDRWSVRLALWSGRALLTLIGCRFRSYVHDAGAIERQLTQAGFVRVFDERTFVWLTRVYQRAAV